MSTPTDTQPDTGRGRRRAYVAGCLVAAVVAAAGGVVLLTGGDEDPAAAPTSPPTTVTSAPPSPTASVAPKPADVAAEEAKAKYVEYLRVDDQFSAGGYTNPTLLDAVAIARAKGLAVLEKRRLAGYSTTGSTKLVSVTVQKVSLPTAPGTYPEVTLSSCLDVSQVQALKGGKPFTPAKRLDRVKGAVLLQKVPASAFDDGSGRSGWFVADETATGAEPC